MIIQRFDLNWEQLANEASSQQIDQLLDIESQYKQVSIEW